MLYHGKQSPLASTANTTHTRARPLCLTDGLLSPRVWQSERMLEPPAGLPPLSHSPRSCLGFTPLWRRMCAVGGGLCFP